MVGKPDVAGVLVPTELRPNFSSLNDVLFPKEVGVLPKGGSTDLGHEVTENELPELWLPLEAVGHEIPISPKVDADDIGIFAIHPGIHLIDTLLAVIAQYPEVFGRNDFMEDHVALFAKLLLLDFRDFHERLPKYSFGRERGNLFLLVWIIEIRTLNRELK
jgi:hypothetical protein